LDFADVGGATEELFNFDNIHNLILIETQVLVLVLTSKVLVLQHWVLILLLAPKVLVLSWSWEKCLVHVSADENTSWNTPSNVRQNQVVLL